jgi:cellulose synthase/poly-beta-1,6-N-acetylglucosamine synthase-like glycosyltransferase
MNNGTGQNQGAPRLGDLLVSKGLLTQARLDEAIALQQSTGQRLGEVLLANGWVDPIEFYKVRDSQKVAPPRIGDLLVSKGLITEEQLGSALQLQKNWGSRLGEILIAKGYISAFKFYQVLADVNSRAFVNLMKDRPDEALLSADDIEIYSELLVLPWKKIDGVTYVATANPSDKVMEFARARFGEQVDFVVTSKFDILWELQINMGEVYSTNAVYQLARKNPENSAQRVFATWQLFGGVMIFALVLTALTLWPMITVIALNFSMALFIFLVFGLRAILAWVGSRRGIDVKVGDYQLSRLVDKDLPVYSILVPMYKEAAVLPYIADALRNMDYPLSKLDIKLILEEDDEETIAVARSLGLESTFEIIIVPTSWPKTKPKACNYALNFCRGEFVTIYDAEDRPEPDQLKKVAVAFSTLPEDVVCLQARLNYFNHNENWLARMFTLEYSLWFDFYLPALEALRIPIPLGGTSNHFRLSVLRRIGAWDPYNVTEDCDLGVRITQEGMHVGIVNSTTYEEANTRFGNWIRQRSRWQKGYMQTYLVHMRHPWAFYKSVGHTGFWGFQFFVGGSVLGNLILPFLFLMFLVYLFASISVVNLLTPIFPQYILYISLFNLLIGNGVLIYLSMVGAFKRHYYELMPYALTVPAYWAMMAIASYKGLWQLINNPFHWEKTEHGLTNANKVNKDAEVQKAQLSPQS